MKILFCGDVIGSSGRESIKNNLPKLKKEMFVDFAVVNVDNAAGGFGVNKKICNEIIEYGGDVLTGGDHIWDQREVCDFISGFDRLLRPLNFPNSSPGLGFNIFKSESGKKILVIHLLGQVFIKNNLNCPFEAVDNVLKNYKLGENVDSIIVDFHAEASSEKMAMGQFLDGRVSLVVGSHTHIPTNDFHIMKNGSGYHSDSGMCGDYNSVIGMEKTAPINAFLSKRKIGRMNPAKGEATFCATLVDLDEKTGLAKNIKAIKIGGMLTNTNI